MDTLSSSFVIDLTINKRSFSYKKFTCFIVDALSLEFYYYKFGGFSAVGNLVCNSARVVDSKRVICPPFFFFQAATLKEEFNIDLRVMGITGSSTMLLSDS